MELCASNLYSRLIDGRLLPFSLRLKWFKECASAIRYLHEQSTPILHRDLKPENVLIRDNNVACICDFGLATHEAKGLTLGVGTLGYQAPEVRTADSQTDKKTQRYSKSSDIWSLGMLMYALLARKHPEHGDPSKISQKLLSLAAEMPEMKDCPSYLELMRSCLSVDPSQRPAAREVETVAEQLVYFD